MNFAHAYPVKIRRLSPLLDCDAITVVAYRAECGCGWRSATRDKMREAQADARDHNQEERRTHGA